MSLVVLLVYLASPICTPFDSRWTIHTATSVVHDGDTDLDEYESYLRADGDYAIERINGHAYNRYPIGTTLLTVPFVAAIDALATIAPVPSTSWIIEHEETPRLEAAVASVLVASAAGILFLVGTSSGLTAPAATLLAATFAFGSSAWSIGSRALWQHGPSMLLATAALFALVEARARPWLAALAGVPLAFGLVVRPTNGIALGILSVYTAVVHRRVFWAYALGVCAILGPFLYWNRLHYGTLVPPYDLPRGQPMAELSNVVPVLLGHLVSPSRGLLVVSPVFLFSLPGFAAYARRRDPLGCTLALIVACQALVISTAGVWWAGHSYGCRFLADVTPFLCYGLVPPLRWLAGAATRTALAGRWIVALLFLWSVLAHGRAAITWDVWAWNSDPVSVDDRPERVWDWRDVQMLRGIQRAAEGVR